MSGGWREVFAHGALVIWPPEVVRSVVNPLREQHDPASAAACEAHITLTQSFVAEPTNADLAIVASVLDRFVSIEISYGPLETFLPYPCVYLAIAPVAQLTELHEALQGSGLFHPVPRHHQRFVPHMTILEGTLSPDDTYLLADELRGTTPAGTFVCDDVAWIVPDARCRFTVARRFAFGKRRYGQWPERDEARDHFIPLDGRRKKDWSGLRSSPSCGQMRGGVSETDH